MPAANPYANYVQTQVKTASPAMLVVLLYEGAVQNLKKGEVCLRDPRRFTDASSHLLKAMNIVTELLGALNPKHSPELSDRLRGIYGYVIELVAKALEGRDPVPVAEAAEIMSSLGDAWRQIAESGNGN